MKMEQPQSTLKQALIPLKDGLDYFQPRLAVSPGSLVGCKNYEALDTVGYKRIDGFERFDGTSGVSSVSIWGLNVAGTEIFNTSFEAAFAAGARLFVNGANYHFGTVLTAAQFGANTAYVVFTAEATVGGPDWPTEGTFVSGDYLIADGDGNLDGFFYPGAGISSITKIDLDTNPLSTVSTSDLIDILNTSADNQRDDKTTYSWGARAHGLHWFKDRLYSVADCEHMYFTTADSVSGQVLYAGETLTMSGGAQVYIYDWRIIEGSLADTDTVIKMLVRRLDDTAIANGETANTSNGRVTNSPLVYSTTLPTLSSGITEPATWGAALYRSTSEAQDVTENLGTGWVGIDMGLEVDFVSGTTTSPPAELRRGDYDDPVATATPSSVTASTTNCAFATTTNQGFTLQGAGASSVGAAIASEDTAKLQLLCAGGSVWGSGGHDGLEVTGFDASDVPEDAYVTGIEVKLYGRTRDSGGGTPSAGDTVSVPDFYLSGLGAGSANRGDVSSYTIGIGPDNTTLTFGSSTDDWGLGTLISRGNLLNSTWGIKARFIPASGLASGEYLEIDRIQVIVHYVPSTTKIFFRNADGDEVSADVIRTYIRTGESGTYPDIQWSSASGTMHMYNITNVAGSATKDYIAPGDIIALTQGGSQIALVSGVKGSFLPTLAEISEKETRYEFITANFYATEDWQAIYGVSGCSRAFVYDEYYFRKIYTAYDSNQDTPRHLAYYRNFLALGYNSGSILLSAIGVTGPEPENFHPFSTASSWNFNDKVFGMEVLPDTSMGVFCEDSIHRMNLDAAGDIIQSTISGNSGVIEYTVAPMGQTVVFCDRRGIRSLDQVDAYGDFIGRPLSTKLGSWMRNRLTLYSPYSGNESTNSPVVAYSVRNKNQYRLWFRDGKQLTLTLMGEDEEPVFTLQHFIHPSSSDDYPEFWVPIAISRGVDQYGRERIHFSHYAPWLASDSAVNADTNKKYVFEMDKGWSFDSEAIHAFIETTYNTLDNPTVNGSLRKVRLWGTSLGLASLYVRTRDEYQGTYSNSTQDLSLPRGGDDGLIADDRYYSNIAQVAARGEVIGLKFVHEPSTPEPTHTLQSLILDYTEGTSTR